MIDVGTEFFRTKKDLTQRCKNMLKNGITNEDQPFLFALIDRHPDAAIKIGPGIKEFFVYQWPNGFRNKCFAIKRIDGTVSTFSYLNCGLSPRSKRTMVTGAFRHTIQDQIIAFRNGARDAGGGILGGHVDHGVGEKSFSGILKAFCVDRSIELLDVEFVEVEDHQELASKGLAADFARYHEARAELRMLDATSNMRQGNGR